MRVRVLGAALGMLLVWIASASPVASVEVASSPERVKPLEVGTRCPAATLRDLEGRAVELGELIGRQPLALVFYRGGW